MTPHVALVTGVDPALLYLRSYFPTPPSLETERRARHLMLTIALTESALRYRQQIGGPASGLYQFETNGGCAEFESARRLALFRRAARDLHLPVERRATAAALRHGADVLAAIMARALLWLDPAPLPEVGEDVGVAYRYYLRRWRPGKPSPRRFTASYAVASEATASAPEGITERDAARALVRDAAALLRELGVCEPAWADRRAQWLAESNAQPWAREGT
jgi:hypothetical protein